MEQTNIREALLKLTDIEKYRRDHPDDRRSDFYDKLDSLGYRKQSGVYFIPYDLANPTSNNPKTLTEQIDQSPLRKDFILKKATRFSDEPFSYGIFLCLRYVYSGSDKIQTPTTSFELKENDICLMNSNFVSSQHLSHEDDIVFSLLFEKKYLMNKILTQQYHHNVAIQFMYNYVLNNNNPQNYILFHPSNKKQIKNIIENLIIEYAFPKMDSQVLIESYLRIFLIYMSRSEYDFELNLESQNSYIPELFMSN